MDRENRVYLTRRYAVLCAGIAACVVAALLVWNFTHRPPTPYSSSTIERATEKCSFANDEQQCLRGELPKMSDDQLERIGYWQQKQADYESR